MNRKSRIIIGIEILGFIILYSLFHLSSIEWIPKCWIYRQTKMLCPACGGTRCMTYFLQGNWRQAFFSHMIFFIGMIYLLSVDIIYIINLNREKKIATWIYPKYWYIIIFVILLIIYTIIQNCL